jgi:hypothetical protein
MTDAERDPIVRRAIDELQAMPKADAAAIRRVVAAAAAARLTPADDEIIAQAPRRLTARSWSIAAIAAAAAFAGFMISNLRPRTPAATAPAAVAQTATTQLEGLQPVANAANDALPVAKQFVFSSRKARSVAVVGDFNGWNASQAKMNRASDGELWSVTIPITPGRHMYGFMIDDSLFMLDPRAPKARDTDLGAMASVTIVSKP